MTTMLRIGILLLLLHPIAAGQQQDPFERYQQGVELYKKAEYKQAIAIFQSLIDDGYADVDLYYNLGNAAYKNGELAVSILSYERALQFEPGNADVAHNLNVVRARLRDRVEPIPLLFFVRWWNDIKDAHQPSAFFTSSLILFCLLCVSGFVFFGFRQVILRRFALVAGIVLLLFFGAAVSLTVLKSNELEEHRNAVIMPSEVTVRSTPDETGVESFIVHEGLKVKILGSKSDYYRIRLEDGKTGWVEKSVLVRI